MRNIIATKLKGILSLLLLRLGGGPAGSRTELKYADLRGANLQLRLQCVTPFRGRGNGKEGVELKYADLRGANLRQVTDREG